jgi:hypothetical protein
MRGPGFPRRGRKSGAPLALAQAILAASDPLQLEGWALLLAADVQVRLGNRPVVVGKSLCVKELGRLFERSEAFGRGFRELWPSDDGSTVLLELDFLPTGSGTPLPMALIARLIPPEPAACELRFYFDPSPLGL